ncbi:hypothetical protein [Paraburkholderia caribensis]|uniref:hypothetical protein n=1 Tax=Paraburkholderia caribensis TaxID=75105 RepID=UPI001D080B1F|nr:hypothetical protein [Paraburkholderia caribensis]
MVDEISVKSRRNVVTRLVALGLFYPLFACGKGDSKMGLFMKTEVVLNVVLFNYFDRSIFEVLLDGNEIGGAGAYGGAVAS